MLELHPAAGWPEHRVEFREGASILDNETGFSGGYSMLRSEFSG